MSKKLFEIDETDPILSGIGVDKLFVGKKEMWERQRNISPESRKRGKIEGLSLAVPDTTQKHIDG